MRRGSVIWALALAAIFGALCSTVSAQPYSPYSSPRYGPRVDAGFFYDGLSPYGDWVEMRDYGWVWAPHVDYGWRPYTLGQWVWTDDDGWYWDSDERFGWATYHYGRWVDDPYYGWIWVPGYEWAPAWVSWRHGNGYIGWAPLPPRASWRAGIGIHFDEFDIDAYIGARDYAFVPERSFCERGVYRQVVPRTQNITIINVTNNITNYTQVNERIVNRGVALENVERAAGRRAPRVRIVDTDRLENAKHLRDAVAVYRPRVEAAPEKAPAHGRSLVRGDEPPAQLLERRRQFERERQKDDTIAVSAKDAEKASGEAEREKARREREGEAREEDKQQRDKKAAPGGSRPEVQTQQDADKLRRDQEQLDQQRREQKQREQQQLDQQRQDQQNQRDLQRHEQEQQQEKQRRDQQQLDQERREQKQREQQQLDQQRQEQQKQRDLERQEQQEKQRRDQEKLDQERREQKQREQQAKEKAKPSPSPTPAPNKKDKDKKNNNTGDPKPPREGRR